MGMTKSTLTSSGSSHRAGDTPTALLAELATSAARQDPYPWYARLHTLGPAHLTDEGTLLAVGYDACATLLRDHRLRKSPDRLLTVSGYPDWERHPALRMIFASMLMLNPPEHTRLRRAISAAFTPARIALLEPAIARLTDELLDELDAHGPDVDFVDGFAFPLPVTVIGELLGIPAADRAQFQNLARDWTAVLDDLSPAVVARADQAAAVIEGYLGDLAATRRTAPRDDLLSALASAPDPMSESDLTTTAALLLAAGFETTTSLLANGLTALLAHPDQADLLRANPELAAPAVEELLRYDTPVQVLYGRTTTSALDLAGLRAPEGTRVITLVGAANRDPSVYVDPDRVNIRRDGPAPLSFGGGIHYCVGAPLARLEGRIAFPRLLNRFPALRLAGAPVPRDGLALHGYLGLPVQLR
jgi:cytochrome P450